MIALVVLAYLVAVLAVLSTLDASTRLALDEAPARPVLYLVQETDA